MEYLITERRQKFESAPAITKNSFLAFINEKMTDLNMQLKKNGYTGRKISKRDLAEMLGISYELLRKYLSREKIITKRDCVIAICMTIYMNASETSKALQLYGMSPIDISNPRDAIISLILDANKINIIHERMQEIDVLNDSLRRNQFSELDIHDFRCVNVEDAPPYPLIEKNVECSADELYYGDPYDSLETMYWLNKYHIIARMWLDDSAHKKVYRLEYDSYGKLNRSDLTGNNRERYDYGSLDDTGEFHDCFKELQRMVMAEKRRMATVLNDTRNYRERKSARIIDGELHVFYETYNYRIPELGEYFLMDYANGQYTLYVMFNSGFMRLFLDKQEYINIYGNTPDIIMHKYTSIQEIEKAVNLERNARKPLIHVHIRAYEKAKKEIENLIEELQTEKVFIRNPNTILDGEFDIWEYYNVKQGLQCTDDKCKSIMYSLADDRIVELTEIDLTQGFKLGLSSIEEIGALKLCKKNLDINSFLGRTNKS